MRQQSQQNIYYMTNHLGHVYGVFDQAGERLNQRGYSPYGQVSGDDFTLQPFGMSPKRSDFESGLVYFGYRFYMPNLGRWLNRDPLQEQGGINLYAYVDGDPLGYVDPDGKIKGRPVNPNPWDHAVYSAQTNSQCVHNCVENIRNLWTESLPIEPESSNSQSKASCDATNKKTSSNSFAAKKSKSEAQETVFEYFRYQSCGIYCEWSY